MNKRLAFVIVPSLFLLSIVAGIAHDMGIEPGFPSSPVTQVRTAPETSRAPARHNAPNAADVQSNRMASKAVAVTPGDPLVTNVPRWQ